MQSVFDSVEIRPNEPVVPQLTTFMKEQMVSGRITDGEDLPSRRMLAARLGINPMTVQKAYKQMEEEGYLVTSAQQGSRIRCSKEQRTALRDELMRLHAETYIQAAKHMDLDLEAAMARIQKQWGIIPQQKSDGKDSSER